MPAFSRLIMSFREHQASCPTFFFFFSFPQQISHRLSDISNSTFLPYIFDFISNPAIPVPLMFINWLYSLRLESDSPSGVKTAPLAAEERRPVHGAQHESSTVLFSPPHCSQAHFTMRDLTPRHRKGCDPARSVLPRRLTQ